MFNLAKGLVSWIVKKAFQGGAGAVVGVGHGVYKSYKLWFATVKTFVHSEKYAKASFKLAKLMGITENIAQARVLAACRFIGTQAGDLVAWIPPAMLVEWVYDYLMENPGTVDEIAMFDELQEKLADGGFEDMSNNAYGKGVAHAMMAGASGIGNRQERELANMHRTAYALNNFSSFEDIMHAIQDLDTVLNLGDPREISFASVDAFSNQGRYDALLHDRVSVNFDGEDDDYDYDDGELIDWDAVDWLLDIHEHGRALYDAIYDEYGYVEPRFFFKKLGKSLKKLGKSVGKAVKKVVDSPIGKIALVAGVGFTGYAIYNKLRAKGLSKEEAEAATEQAAKLGTINAKGEVIDGKESLISKAIELGKKQIKEKAGEKIKDTLGLSGDPLAPGTPTQVPASFVGAKPVGGTVAIKLATLKPEEKKEIVRELRAEKVVVPRDGNQAQVGQIIRWKLGEIGKPSWIDEDPESDYWIRFSKDMEQMISDAVYNTKKKIALSPVAKSKQYNPFG